MINWKNLFWMSTINTSLEKGFYLQHVTIFLFSILQNTFITVNFIWGRTVVKFAKNDQFYELLPPHSFPRVSFLFSKINNKYIFFKTLESSKSLRHSVLCNRANKLSFCLFTRETWKYCCKLSVQTESWILRQFLSFAMLNSIDVTSWLLLSSFLVTRSFSYR